MSIAETTAPKQRIIGRPFQPGQSGNPKGRPAGSRHRLSEQFCVDLADAWQKYGIAALERCATESPDVFVRTIAGLMPKDIRIDATLNVEEFASRYKTALELLGNAEELPKPRRQLRIINADRRR
jgi:Family of unknown function (DUF5681)